MLCGRCGGREAVRCLVRSGQRSGRGEVGIGEVSEGVGGRAGGAGKSEGTREQPWLQRMAEQRDCGLKTEDNVRKPTRRRRTPAAISQRRVAVIQYSTDILTRAYDTRLLPPSSKAAAQPGPSCSQSSRRPSLLLLHSFCPSRMTAVEGAEESHCRRRLPHRARSGFDTSVAERARTRLREIAERVSSELQSYRSAVRTGLASLVPRSAAERREGAWDPVGQTTWKAEAGPLIPEAVLAARS